MRTATALLAALAAGWLAAAVGAGAHRRPLAYPHLKKDWQELRARCEAQNGGCATCTGAAKENCVLQCMSPSCYAWQYGSNALEEGEEDSMRGQRFRTCALREVREARAVAAGLPAPHRVPGFKRYNAAWGGAQ